MIRDKCSGCPAAAFGKVACGLQGAWLPDQVGEASYVYGIGCSGITAGALREHCVNNAPAEAQVLSQLVVGERHAKSYPGL